MLFNVINQSPQKFPRVIARAFVVDFPECSLNRVGLRAIARKPENLEARMLREPAFDRLGLVDDIVVGDQIDALDLWAAGPVEQGEQFTEQQIRSPVKIK